MRKLQTRLLEARGAMSRAAVAEAALAVAGGDPDFSGEDVQRHETRIVTPPTDGLKLRTHCAAVADLPWTEALGIIGTGYWPPLNAAPAGGSPIQDIKAVLDRHGLRIVARDEVRRRIVVQL